MPNNKDFLLGKMTNEDEIAIYDAIKCVNKSISNNDNVIDLAGREISDENLNDKVIGCIKRNTELIVSNTADVIRSSYNVTEMSSGDISRIINDVYEECNKAEQLIQNTSDGDIRNMLEKYKEVYTQLAAYAILWEK